MRVLDVLGMCLRNLYKRKLRTLLTLLGVMIGTGSIILMISLGLATDAQFAQMAEDMNLDMTRIQVWPQWRGGQMNPDGSWTENFERELNDYAVREISRIPGVQVATPIVRGWLLFRSGPYAMRTGITGINAAAMELMGHELAYGRFIEPGEEFAAIFSAHTEREFFDITGIGRFGGFIGSDRNWGDDDPPTLVDIFNDSIRVYYDDNHFWNLIFGGADDEFGIGMEDAFRQPRSFEIDVVGVLVEPEQIGMWRNIQTDVFMDIETLRSLERFQSEARRTQREEHGQFSLVRDGLEQEEIFQNLFVRATSIDETSEVANAIREMGFDAHYDGEWIETTRAQTRGIETLLTAIAIVSLVVAAINIANTMITSVTERTREIGILKVIGARVSDILKLFLLEAIVIGIIGGIFGVALALGVSYGMNNFDIAFLDNLGLGAPDWATGGERGTISLITPWLCGLALAVAAGVGLVSGFFPAWRATRLSALAAIRGD